jgi:hypothetical protein
MANFTIVQNTTKYSHKDIMAFIEEMEWYVAKIESYAPNGSPDHYSGHARHVDLSNYASQSLSNRLKYDFVYGAVCPVGGQKCGCDFIGLKLINPERLQGGSAMHMLARGLGGLQKRASRELMTDLTRYLSRHLGWGRHQDETTSSIWRMGWGHDDAYDMASYLQRELMDAGMGVGIEGKDIWDHEKAEQLRPKILQKVLGLLDRHCVDNTHNILHRTTNDITKLIMTFGNVRQGHKDNDTTGSIDAENVTIATLRKLLNELEAVQKGD